MARSHVIYVVEEARVLGTIKAAFTVKHELMTWLERTPGPYHVWRVPDGGRGEPVLMDITP